MIAYGKKMQQSLPVFFKTEKKFLLMAPVGDVPDQSGAVVSGRSWHKKNLF
jgi:hypothetical protein